MEIEQLRTRREERRRSIRRRRRVAVCLLALVTALGATAAVLAGSSGGSSSKRRAATLPTHRQATGSAHTALAAASAPSSERTGPPGTDPVPILMYHVIATPPPGAPFPGLYVEPAEFAEQMHALKGAGWHAVTLDQVEAYWRRGV